MILEIIRGGFLHPLASKSPIPPSDPPLKLDVIFLYKVSDGVSIEQENGVISDLG